MRELVGGALRVGMRDPACGTVRVRDCRIPRAVRLELVQGRSLRALPLEFAWAVQVAVPFEFGWAIPQAVPLEVVQVRPLRAVLFELAWAMLQAVRLEFMHVQSCGWFPWSWWMGERVDGAARVCPKA